MFEKRIKLRLELSWKTHATVVDEFLYGDCRFCVKIIKRKKKIHFKRKIPFYILS